VNLAKSKIQNKDLQFDHRQSPASDVGFSPLPSDFWFRISDFDPASPLPKPTVNIDIPIAQSHTQSSEFALIFDRSLPLNFSISHG
jgi:hypothetical protein